MLAVSMSHTIKCNSEEWIIHEYIKEKQQKINENYDNSLNHGKKATSI
jgi:hypothetical protein